MGADVAKDEALVMSFDSKNSVSGPRNSSISQIHQAVVG